MCIRDRIESLQEYTRDHAQRKIGAEKLRADRELEVRRLRQELDEKEQEMGQASQDIRDSKAIMEENLERLLELNVPIKDLESSMNPSQTIHKDPVSRPLPIIINSSTTDTSTTATPCNPMDQMALAMAEAFKNIACLLYTSDAADDLTRVDLGGRRIIK